MGIRILKYRVGKATTRPSQRVRLKSNIDIELLNMTKRIAYSDRQSEYVSYKIGDREIRLATEIFSKSHIFLFFLMGCEKIFHVLELK